MDTNSIVKFEARKVADRVWLIQGAAHELMYVACGTEKAMLVDTGMGVGNLKAVVRGLTDLPLVVVNTHGHPDHAGGNPAFSEVWISPKDDAIMSEMCSDQYRLEDLRAANGPDNPAVPHLAQAMVRWQPYTVCPLKEGQRIDLGGRSFEVIEVPGHTPGCVCLVDPVAKVLFAGDTIVATPAWLYLKHSLPLKVYHESLLRLRGREREYETLLPGHLPSPLGKEQLYDLIACVEEILVKPDRGTPEKTFAGEGLLWAHGGARIIYNPANLV